MKYNHFTILPTDDPDFAVRMFIDILREEPITTLLVLGADADAETLTNRAARIADREGSPWHVIWARDPAQIWPVVRDIPTKVKLPVKPDGVRCVGFGWSDEIVGVVRRSQPLPDLAEVLQLLTQLAGGRM